MKGHGETPDDLGLGQQKSEFKAVWGLSLRTVPVPVPQVLYEYTRLEFSHRTSAVRTLTGTYWSPALGSNNSPALHLLSGPFPAFGGQCPCLSTAFVTSGSLFCPLHFDF